MSGEILLEDPEVALVRFDCKDVRVRKPAQKVDGRVAHVGATVDNESGSAIRIQCVIRAVDKYLSEDSAVGRGDSAHEGVRTHW
jgi:hypothetical protein